MAGKHLPFRVVDERLAARFARDYQHIVIDTEAHPAAEDLKALADGCDLLVIPSTPDAMALEALMLTVNALTALGSDRYRILLNACCLDPGMKLSACALLVLIGISGTAGCVSKPTLAMFQTDDPPCYDRSSQSQTSVVDTHLHFRPFGGPAIPFEEMVSYLQETGVLFANIAGIGQMLPPASSCTYYLECPGTPVTPTLKNDFVNAANYSRNAHPGVHLTLSMTFPDLSRPEAILRGMHLLEKEYPGAFTWMGEVNLVKRALFPNGHTPVALATLTEWAPFMEALRERDIPLAVHADLGTDEDPTRHLPLLQEVLRLYPENAIVWVHMGLSRELVDMNAAQHIQMVTSLLDRYPKLMVDISWRVIDDAYFSQPDKWARYVPFLNDYSERILPGTDFLASRDKDIDVYRTELYVTSQILRDLHDTAFRNIALGQNYFRLLDLDYTAPPVCE